LPATPLAKCDLASDKIADSGLRHAKELGCLRLGQASGINQLAEANHQIRTHLEIRCLLSREAEILEDIAARTSDLCGHGIFTFLLDDG
jgi:hypothetical protein